MAKRKKFIHINRRLMAANIKSANNAEKVIIARYRSGGESIHSNCILLVDENGQEIAKVVADVSRPLSCGARAYVETELRVVDGNDPSVELR